MVNGRCKYGYPKSFTETTNCDIDGFPQYRRRDNGRTVTMVSGRVVDNRWVVPHNQKLSTLFNAHINVEVCSSVSAVKYIHKYIYKGNEFMRRNRKERQ